MEQLRCWTKKELKLAYKISGVKLLEWLLLIPSFMDKKTLKKTRKFNPLQAKKIFAHLGEPSN